MCSPPIDKIPSLYFDTPPFGLSPVSRVSNNFSNLTLGYLLLNFIFFLFIREILLSKKVFVKSNRSVVLTILIFLLMMLIELIYKKKK